MKNIKKLFCPLLMFLSLSSTARALTYTNQNLEMMLCFRQVGSANPYDLEVNLGSVTRLIALPTNSMITITQFTTAQLSNAMASLGTFDNTSFSVTASAFAGPTNSLGVAVDTLWATIPRTDPATANPPWTREIRTKLAGAANAIYSIGNLASTYSRTHVSDPLVNTSTAVGIPPGNPYSCEGYLGPGGDISGNYFVVENAAPSPFTDPIVSDLFMEVPLFYPDPLQNNATNGPTDYLGYFTLSPSGALTFTRQSSPTVPQPPPPPTLTISRTGQTSTISFGTTNGATYSLIYTNTSGLSVPRSAWPMLGNPITGNGGRTNFVDTTAAANRVYSVKAQ
jgi:hypothetical protein